MKILMVFHLDAYPPVFGAAKREFPFFRENCKRHTLSLISPGSPALGMEVTDLFGKNTRRIVFVDTRRPRIFSLLIRIWLFLTGKSSFHLYHSTRFQKALDKLFAEEHFDLIHCATVLLSFYRFPPGIPMVADTQNVEYDIFFRSYQQARGLQKLYYKIEYRRGKKMELRCFECFDAVITTTERDLNVFRKDILNTKMCTISSGVEEMFLEPQEMKPEPWTMLFTGLMDYHPNSHGILYFLDEIFPLILKEAPEARVFIVGAKPSGGLLRRASENVIVTGYVPDVREYMRRAQVFIIPLLIGGGIRTKALEAMAIKIPIVSTTIGCEGIYLKHEESALFADTPGEFASAVLRFFKDRELCTRFVEKAHASLLKHYSWEASGLALERVYQSVLGKGIKG